MKARLLATALALMPVQLIAQTSPTPMPQTPPRSPPTEWYVLIGTVQVEAKGDIVTVPGCTALVVRANEAQLTTKEIRAFTLNVTKRLGPFNSAGLAMQALDKAGWKTSSEALMALAESGC